LVIALSYQPSFVFNNYAHIFVEIIKSVSSRNSMFYLTNVLSRDKSRGILHSLGRFVLFTSASGTPLWVGACCLAKSSICSLSDKFSWLNFGINWLFLCNSSLLSVKYVLAKFKTGWIEHLKTFCKLFGEWIIFMETTQDDMYNKQQRSKTVST